MELCPYSLRAKMWALVLLVIYVAQVFGNYVNPVGIAAIGRKFYIYYCVWVTIIFFIVYFTFVETRGPTLEELAMIFDDAPMSDRKMSLVNAESITAMDPGKVAKEGVQVEMVEA